MTLFQAVEIWNSNAGGIMVFVIILFSIIQITPIKINPISWFGKTLNKDLSNKVEQNRKDLAEHIAQDHRNKIFRFQNELLNGICHTKEEFDEVLDACAYYEEYVDKNNITNGKAVEAIKYLRTTYQKCLAKGDFVNI